MGMCVNICGCQGGSKGTDGGGGSVAENSLAEGSLSVLLKKYHLNNLLQLVAAVLIMR